MQKEEVFINFESEKREGIVAVGTYLIDAAKRLGINIECDCNIEEVEPTQSCMMKISKGETLLSEPTLFEKQHLSSQAIKNGERLSCQAKIEKSGEITVMSVKKKADAEEEKTSEEEIHEEFKKEFEELPLEKKIANLVELEAIALSETFSFVLNSPYAAVGKVMDVLAGFGLKMEKEDKEAKRPDEHKFVDVEEANSAQEKSSTTAKKKSASKSTAKKKVTVKKTNSKKKADSAKATDKNKEADKKETKQEDKKQ
ncbi:MAG: 2Fe-2S iron-sulfur cluster-binding protein [Aridibacter sp.]